MLKKPLKKLKSLEANVFSRGHKSLRDRWRMVRYLPELVRNLIAALEIISKQKPAKATVVHVPVAQATSSDAPVLPTLILSSIRDQVRSGRLLVVIPEGSGSQFSIDSSNAPGMSVTMGSSTSVITADQVFDAVVYLGATEPQFCEANRYYLKSGRIAQYLWKGSELSFIPPTSSR